MKDAILTVVAIIGIFIGLAAMPDEWLTGKTSYSSLVRGETCLYT